MKTKDYKLLTLVYFVYMKSGNTHLIVHAALGKSTAPALGDIYWHPNRHSQYKRCQQGQKKNKTLVCKCKTPFPMSYIKILRLIK